VSRIDFNPAVLFGINTIFDVPKNFSASFKEFSSRGIKHSS